VFRQAQEVGRILQAAGVAYILNDRADVALMAGADGVHVGQEDLPPESVRGVVGSRLLVGYSTHTPQQMRAAEREPVDYVAFGPVFATGSKEKADPVVGLAGLREARRLTQKPLVAIGGITRENVAAVLEAGADAVAVISGLLGADWDGRLREWLQLTGR
ncbi:MAG TPA: thiamine phosphate synthase, partial [Bryobacterales bacterium]|nr:thiamine phosphate synthase [Bryobacterales bacterium]